MANVWLDYVFRRSGSRGGERLTLLALADRANAAGRCYCGVADIAARAGLSERRARACLRALIARGELSILKHGGGVRPDGKGRANTFQLVALAEPEAGRTLSPASGFAAPDTRTNGAGTLTAPTANPEVSGIEPCRPRQGNPTEPTVNPRENPGADGGPVGVAVAAAADDARVADPDAASFQSHLIERRAAERRRAGGQLGKPISSAAAQFVPQADKPRRRRGRLPDGVQALSFRLLRNVPGLCEADARDLATLAGPAEFAAALGIMPADLRSVGGWLRCCVLGGWAKPAAARVADGPEVARG
ncbi:MAG: helix-turn-helix domain-containing protein [Phycisphaerae bacterium]|nr:helix-turn-helix domain-containing protein [Phycisphaerae bacterium]